MSSTLITRVSIVIVTLLFMMAIVVTMGTASGKSPGQNCDRDASTHNEGIGNCQEGDTSVKNPENDPLDPKTGTKSGKGP